MTSNDMSLLVEQRSSRVGSEPSWVAQYTSSVVSILSVSRIFYVSLGAGIVLCCDFLRTCNGNPGVESSRASPYPVGTR